MIFNSVQHLLSTVLFQAQCQNLGPKYEYGVILGLKNSVNYGRQNL